MILYEAVMALRLRILLWVSLLFLATIFFIFITSHYEVTSNLKKEENNLVEKVKQVDRENVDNILKFLSLSINNEAEKMYSVFETLKTSGQWRLRFLPDQFNLDTKSWGSSAAVLATFPWLEFINIQLNEDLGACIRQADPFLNKFVKVPIAEDLIVFITKKDDGKYYGFIGVPFWSNQTLLRYIEDKDFPDFFLAKQPDQWLLYEVNDLLKLSPEEFKQKNFRLYKHLFDEAITLHSNEEYNFLIQGLKIMVKVLQKKVTAYPDLISVLSNSEKTQIFAERALKQLKPDIGYERSYCDSALCEYEIERFPEKPWSTRRNFEHQITQKQLIWEIGMLVRTGISDFTPFGKNMPQGIVTAIDPMSKFKPNFYDNVTEGIFIKDVFLNKTIVAERLCDLKTGNPEYDLKVIFKGDKSGIAKSCRNKDLKIYYDGDLKEPYLTSTSYITYFKPPMKKPNEAAITLGVALDPILINIALVSPDEIAFVHGDGNIRFYSTDGNVTNIENDSDENRIKLLTQKSGNIINDKGEPIFFQNLGKITRDGGQLILIEKQESRSAIIGAINNHVSGLTKRVTIHSSVMIIISLIIIIFVLSRVISAITKPINDLAEATALVSDRKLSDISLNKSYKKRKDEVGTLYNSFAQMIHTMMEGEKVRGLLNKVVSKQVAEKILKEGVQLGGELRTLTVLFCDIRNFTSITEKMDPQEVIIMLNECLTLLSGIIDDFEGVIDKYEGDKIMTLFGAPITTNDHQLQAVLCAIEMQNALALWNQTREQNGFCKLEVGIGIHTGEAVAGNVGAENHLSYTVLGHIVNLSSRLCDFARARETLITQETLEPIKEFIEYKENPPQKFKGISERVVTYSVIKKKS